MIIEGLLIAGVAALGAKGLKEAFKDEESTRKTMGNLDRMMNNAANRNERMYQSGRLNEEDYSKNLQTKGKWDDFYNKIK